MARQHRLRDGLTSAFLALLAVLYLAPILIVLLNSFKG